MKRPGMLALALALAVGVLGAPVPGWSGPDDPSRLDTTPYAPQKVVYHFNLASPEQGIQSLRYLRNHLKTLKEHGAPGPSSIAVVANGNELHAFSRLNQVAYPEVYGQLKELTAQGVEFRVCANAAKARGYQPDAFYDLVTVVPAGVTELARYQNTGHAYILATAHEVIKREALLAKYPELGM